MHVDFKQYVRFVDEQYHWLQRIKRRDEEQKMGSVATFITVETDRQGRRISRR